MVLTERLSLSFQTCQSAKQHLQVDVARCFVEDTSVCLKGSQWASRERLHDPRRSTKVCQRLNPLWTSNFIFILHWIPVRPITYISSYIGLGKFTEMGLQALTAACQSTPAASCGIAVTCFTCQCRKKLEFVAAHRQER